MENSHLFLSKHTYYCLADNHYVFLDLREDQYLCLARAESGVLGGLLSGHNSDSTYPMDARLIEQQNSDSNTTIRRLLGRGLLVDNEIDGKLPALPRVEQPVTSLAEEAAERQPSYSLTEIWRFFGAAASASKDLRFRPIEQTVRRVERRKPSYATVPDYNEISDLYGIFQALRPYYPRPYLCLFDSLALIHFLARYGLFPQWVYGVQLEPFNAHCWIQVDDRVINDTVDGVRNYTPIMSI